MSGPRGPFDDVSIKKIRNANNTVPGILIVLGVIALVAYMDPLFVYYSQPSEDNPKDVFLIFFTLAMSAICLVAHILLARSRVDVTDDYLVLRNPLQETAVPRAGACLVRGATRGFPKLRAHDGSEHVAWGGEDAALTLQDFLKPLDPSKPHAVQVRRRSPGCTALGLVLLWATYMLIGLIVW